MTRRKIAKGFEAASDILAGIKDPELRKQLENLSYAMRVNRTKVRKVS